MAPEPLDVEVDSSDGSTLGRQIDLDDVPSQEDLKILRDFLVQDHNGKEVQFGSIYTGLSCPRRVLMIFTGHFLNPVWSLASLLTCITLNGLEMTCEIALTVVEVNSTVKSIYA
jgi:hypothetical protein